VSEHNVEHLHDETLLRFGQVLNLFQLLLDARTGPRPPRANLEPSSLIDSTMGTVSA
jgi:hypothetical protein